LAQDRLDLYGAFEEARNYVPRDRKTQPGPFAKRLRRKELVKNPVEVFGGDPAALVDDSYLENVAIISHLDPNLAFVPASEFVRVDRVGD
jgi:hypothetical protein